MLPFCLCGLFAVGSVVTVREDIDAQYPLTCPVSIVSHVFGVTATCVWNISPSDVTALVLLPLFK